MHVMAETSDETNMFNIPSSVIQCRCVMLVGGGLYSRLSGGWDHHRNQRDHLAGNQLGLCPFQDLLTNHLHCQLPDHLQSELVVQMFQHCTQLCFLGFGMDLSLRLTSVDSIAVSLFTNSISRQGPNSFSDTVR